MGYEKKLIPALDIKTLESVDSLTFSIILHDECLLNNYDEQLTKPSTVNKTKNRASQILAAGTFGLLGSNA